MFKVIAFISGDKDDDSDGTLIQSNSKTLSVCRMAFAQQVLPLFINAGGRDGLGFKEIVLEVVACGFW